MKKLLALFAIFAFPVLVAFYATKGNLSLDPSSLGFGFMGMAAIAYGAALFLGPLFARIPLVAASVALLVVGWMDAVCLYMLHAPFDFVFMFHVDLNTFKFMTGPEIAVFVGMGLAIAACGVAFELIYRATAKEGKTTNLSLKVALIVLGAACVIIFDTPCKDLVHYFQRIAARSHAANLSDAEMLALGVKTCPVEYDSLTSTKGKNLVFIYLESLEGAFLDESLFPGLCPNMNALRKEAVVFDNVTPGYHATYSFGGLYSSMTGSTIVTAQVPCVFERNTGVKPSYGGRILSVPSILAKAGYCQEFIHGGDPEFSGLGPFLKHEHVDNYIRPTGGSFAGGCYDDGLFDVAFAEYLKLSESDRPFNITMFTLDTHTGCPIGSDWPRYDTGKIKNYPSKSDTVLTAIMHTDAALGKLIAKMKNTKGWNNTVVFIMNDHYCWNGEYSATLEQSKHRNMNMFALNAGAPATIKTEGKTFDVAPTVLDLLGVKHNYTFPVGEDLLGTPHNARLSDDTVIREECLNAYLLRKSESANKKDLFSKATQSIIARRNIVQNQKGNQE